MLTIFLLLLYLISTCLGIYVYDYQVDNMINDGSVIFLSILAGLGVVLVFVLLYIEVLYLIIAKRRNLNDMTKHRIAKQFMAVPIYFMNMRIQVEGKENLPKETGFSIYSNHTSLMDIPILMYKLYDYPIAFLAKEVVQKIPLLGKWTFQLGCVMIDRSSAREGAKSIIQVIHHIKDGSSMVIFPEGTRGTDPVSLLPFKDGAFKAALKSKAPLVPITIRLNKEYRKIKWPMKRNITIIVHPAIPFEEYKTLKTNDLAQQVYTIIASKLDK